MSAQSLKSVLFRAVNNQPRDVHKVVHESSFVNPDVNNANDPRVPHPAPAFKLQTNGLEISQRGEVASSVQIVLSNGTLFITAPISHLLHNTGPESGRPGRVIWIIPLLAIGIAIVFLGIFKAKEGLFFSGIAISGAYTISLGPHNTPTALAWICIALGTCFLGFYPKKCKAAQRTMLMGANYRF